MVDGHEIRDGPLPTTVISVVPNPSRQEGNQDKATVSSRQAINTQAVKARGGSIEDPIITLSYFSGTYMAAT